jgi:hypothetical protein
MKRRACSSCGKAEADGKPIPLLGPEGLRLCVGCCEKAHPQSVFALVLSYARVDDATHAGDSGG